MKKERKLDWFVRNQLANWGVTVIPRPDYWDNRNRTVTVVIDESLPDEEIIFENPVTIRLNTGTLEDRVETLSANVSNKWMELFITAINFHSRVYIVKLRELTGTQATEWIEAAINRINYMIDVYQVGIKRFTDLDFAKCIKHFGGERNFRWLIIDAVGRNPELVAQMTRCLICKNCRCKKNGERKCRRVFVPVEENGVRTLRMVTDMPISDRLSDIIPTFESREECPQFEPNDTGFIDWVVRFRNAHF